MMGIIQLTIFIVSFFSLGHSKTLLRHSNLRVDPEVNYNTSQLITSKGYPCQEYDVTTEDGYILGVQRIPHGRKPMPANVTRPVVLLMHGLLSCSACWVENLANNSLGFMMADAGFDVWLGNCRGNTYARRHKTLSPQMLEFWEFSFDEMAKYDLPATIDKILAVTGAASLFYVGHSQGGGIAYAMLSTIQAYQSKVKAVAGLAPGVYINHMKSPLRYLEPYADDFEILDELLGHGEFLHYSPFFNIIAKDFCDKQLPAIVCENILFLIAGFDVKETNISRIPVYIGQHPAGSSAQNIEHFAQMIVAPEFQMMDFGSVKNMQIYHQPTPPLYNISNIQVPIAIYRGTNDWLVGPDDTSRLVAATPNILVDKMIQGWQHLDFIWAMNAPQMCYNDLIHRFKTMVQS